MAEAHSSGRREPLEGDKIDVLVVEDERALWRSYQARLDDLTLAFAASLAEARVRLAERAFDVVLLDLSLPDGDGLWLLDDIGKSSPRPGVVVVSGYLSADRLLSLYRQRILAIPKRADDRALRDAIATASGHPSYPDIVRTLCARHGLSRAETDVVLLAVEGKGTVEVAAALGCHPRTVESHWHKVFNKTGLRSKPDVLAAILRLI